jgi:uncharacterized membrane protein YsdA (DUF1294 family)
VFGRPFFHHKTRKPVFMRVLIVSLIIHITIWGIIIYLRSL